MKKTTQSDPKLKQAVKNALLELIAEQPGLFRELLMETIEDMALVNAMEEGRKSKPVSRDEVFAVLRGKK